MMFQANGAATRSGAGLGLRAGQPGPTSTFEPAHRPSSAALGSARRKQGIGALLAGALLASVATPVMVAADMSGIIVAAPLFVAGLAVACASLLAPNARKSQADAQTNLPTSKLDASAALPLADLFRASAFVVSPAGVIFEANEAGALLKSNLAQQFDPPVLFDLLTHDSRTRAMAGLKDRNGHPIEVRTRDGAAKLLHVIGAERAENVIALIGDRSSETTVEPLDTERKSGALSETMLATVSHELRTPLNAIIGFSGILENELFGKLGSERQREYVGLIQSSGRHLLSVVNEILDVSKIEAGAYQLNCEHFLLDELVEEASAMVRCQAEDKKLAIEILGPAGGTMIHGDRRAMHHMLVNLLANAVKFTDEGSVTLSWERAGRDLKLSVADTGVGIPADQIGKLGVPFVQASSGLARKYEGTGLGLAYVRGMSELHGGAMMIASQEGEGTTVTLDLPLVPRQAANMEDQTIVALNHARRPNNQDQTHAPQRRTA